MVEGQLAALIRTADGNTIEWAWPRMVRIRNDEPSSSLEGTHPAVLQRPRPTQDVNGS